MGLRCYTPAPSGTGVLRAARTLSGARALPRRTLSAPTGGTGPAMACRLPPRVPVDWRLVRVIHDRRKHATSRPVSNGLRDDHDHFVRDRRCPCARADGSPGTRHSINQVANALSAPGIAGAVAFGSSDVEADVTTLRGRVGHAGHHHARPCGAATTRGRLRSLCSA